MARLDRFHPRERRLALIAGAIIGCWGIVSWVMQPLWDRIKDLRQHVESQTEKLAAFSSLLEQAPSVERSHQQFAAYLSAKDDEQGQGAFLNELETLCRAANLQLNLKPRPAKHEERVSRFEVELDVEGAQANLLAFLDSLLHLPKLVSLERVRMSSVPTKESILHANVVIQLLALR